MATDVSSLVEYKHDRTTVKDFAAPITTVELMTRDLLGSGGCKGGGGGGDDQSLKLDLDLQVSIGGEKRVDLKSGKVYLKQQCNSRNLLSLFDYSSLELTLVPSSLSVSSSNLSFQSVCTLDKVKSALERDIKKRQSSDDGVCDQTMASPVAAGCPRCLTYVLVSKNNRKCPRCHLFVPLPIIKKPKIDLNISI